MIRLHSPWPLFSDDLGLARSWLLPQLQGFVSVRTGHLAISHGMDDVLLDGVEAGAVQADASALRQWRFRIARLNQEPNPYRYLRPEKLFEDTLALIAYSKTTGRPLCVQLIGGIGDHLEALSLLLPWTKAQNFCLNIAMGAERKQQIEPLLLQWDHIRCITRCEQGASFIPVMALRAAVVENSDPTLYHPWIPLQHTNQTTKRDWLFCWRAEGAGDRCSAHNRSVPWALVQKFYCHLKRLKPNSCLVDITNWRNWEANQLRGMGVEILDPRQGTLLDLAERCNASNVVTIDTALVHLCAAAGQQANLLLSAFPDERWQELHRPEHSYGQLIQLWRSSQFGSWSAVLDSLITSLAREN